MTHLDALKKLGIVLATVIITALPVSPANAYFSYTDQNETALAIGHLGAGLLTSLALNPSQKDILVKISVAGLG